MTDGMQGRLAKGATWVAAARVLIGLVGFASTVILARLLTPADFGLVAIVSTVTIVIGAITELSLAEALLQHRDPSDAHFHSAFTLNLLRSALLAAIVVASALPLSWIYNDPRLTAPLLVVGASTFLAGAFSPRLVTFQRRLIFWQDFAMGVSQKLAGFVVSIALAVMFRSYWALIFGIVATQLTALIASYVLAPYRPRLMLAKVRDLLSFSIWLSLGQAVNTLNWRSDQLILGYVLGPATLGVYTVGDNLANMPTREATTPLAQTLFPGFARMIDEPDRLREAYQRAQSFLCAVALPVGVGFALLARPVVLVTLGEKWMSAVVIIQFLSVIGALTTLSSALQPLAMAMGETRDLFVRDLINISIRLPLIVAGLLLGGLIGVIYARCISSMISTLINMAMAKRLLGLPIHRQFQVNFRALASVVLMAIVVHAADLAIADPVSRNMLVLKLMLLGAVGAISYSGCSYFLWTVKGRGEGAERELAQLIQTFIRRKAL